MSAIVRTYTGIVLGHQPAMKYDGQRDTHAIVQLEVPGVQGVVPVPVAELPIQDLNNLVGRMVKITCPNSARYSEKQRQTYVRDEPGTVGPPDRFENQASNWGAPLEKAVTPQAARPQTAAAK